MAVGCAKCVPAGVGVAVGGWGRFLSQFKRIGGVWVRGRKLRHALLALPCALTLGGCFVTPQAITFEERAAQAATDVAQAANAQEPLKHALTLDEAFARALAYNLDARVKLIEAAVSRDDLNLFGLDMLPKVVASAGHTERDNVDASSSTSILTNRQSLEPSTSSDKVRRSADLSLSWNVLDFGASYFNARQQANRTLIIEEQRRKAVHLILQDVRRAFWRAAGAQRLSAEVRATIAESERAVESGRKLESEALRSPVDALRYQKAMLDQLRQLGAVEGQLSAAKVELAALINLPPGTRFSLAIPPERIRTVSAPLREMEEYALIHNPDVREQAYQTRISADETRKAILKLLPGVNLSYGRFYDANSFYVNNAWSLGAMRIAWNVVNLLYAPHQIQRAKNFEELADLKRQAISMTVMARVHIAYLRYLSAAKEYRWTATMASVDRRLFQQISNRAQNDAQSELERVSAKASAVFSDVRRYQAYGEMQAALGQLFAALGIDPLPQDVGSLDLASLVDALRKAQRTQISTVAPAADAKQTETADAAEPVMPADAARVDVATRSDQ